MQAEVPGPTAGDRAGSGAPTKEGIVSPTSWGNLAVGAVAGMAAAAAVGEQQTMVAAQPMQCIASAMMPVAAVTSPAPVNPKSMVVSPPTGGIAAAAIPVVDALDDPLAPVGLPTSTVQPLQLGVNPEDAGITSPMEPQPLLIGQALSPTRGLLDFSSPQKPNVFAPQSAQGAVDPMTPVAGPPFPRQSDSSTSDTFLTSPTSVTSVTGPDSAMEPAVVATSPLAPDNAAAEVADGVTVEKVAGAGTGAHRDLLGAMQAADRMEVDIVTAGAVDAATGAIESTGDAETTAVPTEATLPSTPPQLSPSRTGSRHMSASPPARVATAATVADPNKVPRAFVLADDSDSNGEEVDEGVAQSSASCHLPIIAEDGLHSPPPSKTASAPPVFESRGDRAAQTSSQPAGSTRAARPQRAATKARRQKQTNDAMEVDTGDNVRARETSADIKPEPGAEQNLEEEEEEDGVADPLSMLSSAAEFTKVLGAQSRWVRGGAPPGPLAVLPGYSPLPIGTKAITYGEKGKPWELSAEEVQNNNEALLQQVSFFRTRVDDLEDELGVVRLQFAAKEAALENEMWRLTQTVQHGLYIRHRDSQDAKDTQREVKSRLKTEKKHTTQLKDEIAELSKRLRSIESEHARAAADLKANLAKAQAEMSEARTKARLAEAQATRVRLALGAAAGKGTEGTAGASEGATAATGTDSTTNDTQPSSADSKAAPAPDPKDATRKDAARKADSATPDSVDVSEAALEAEAISKLRILEMRVGHGLIEYKVTSTPDGGGGGKGKTTWESQLSLLERGAIDAIIAFELEREEARKAQAAKNTSSSASDGAVRGVGGPRAGTRHKGASRTQSKSGSRGESRSQSRGGSVPPSMDATHSKSTAVSPVLLKQALSGVAPERNNSGGVSNAWGTPTQPVGVTSTGRVLRPPPRFEAIPAGRKRGDPKPAPPMGKPRKPTWEYVAVSSSSPSPASSRSSSPSPSPPPHRMDVRGTRVTRGKGRVTRVASDEADPAESTDGPTERESVSSSSGSDDERDPPGEAGEADKAAEDGDNALRSLHPAENMDTVLTSPEAGSIGSPFSRSGPSAAGSRRTSIAKPTPTRSKDATTKKVATSVATSAAASKPAATNGGAPEAGEATDDTVTVGVGPKRTSSGGKARSRGGSREASPQPVNTKKGSAVKLPSSKLANSVSAFTADTGAAADSGASSPSVDGGEGKKGPSWDTVSVTKTGRVHRPPPRFEAGPASGKRPVLADQSPSPSPGPAAETKVAPTEAPASGSGGANAKAESGEREATKKGATKGGAKAAATGTGGQPKGVKRSHASTDHTDQPPKRLASDTAKKGATSTTKSSQPSSSTAPGADDSAPASAKDGASQVSRSSSGSKKGSTAKAPPPIRAPPGMTSTGRALRPPPRFEAGPASGKREGPPPPVIKPGWEWVTVDGTPVQIPPADPPKKNTAKKPAAKPAAAEHNSHADSSKAKPKEPAATKSKGGGGSRKKEAKQGEAKGKGSGGAAAKESGGGGGGKSDAKGGKSAAPAPEAKVVGLQALGSRIASLLKGTGAPKRSASPSAISSSTSTSTTSGLPTPAAPTAAPVASTPSPAPGNSGASEGSKASVVGTDDRVGASARGLAAAAPSVRLSPTPPPLRKAGTKGVASTTSATAAATVPPPTPAAAVASTTSTRPGEPADMNLNTGVPISKPPPLKKVGPPPLIKAQLKTPIVPSLIRDPSPVTVASTEPVATAVGTVTTGTATATQSKPPPLRKATTPVLSQPPPLRKAAPVIPTAPVAAVGAATSTVVPPSRPPALRKAAAPQTNPERASKEGTQRGGGEKDALQPQPLVPSRLAAAFATSRAAAAATAQSPSPILVVPSTEPAPVQDELQQVAAGAGSTKKVATVSTPSPPPNHPVGEEKLASKPSPKSSPAANAKASKKHSRAKTQPSKPAATPREPSPAPSEPTEQEASAVAAPTPTEPEGEESTPALKKFPTKKAASTKAKHALNGGSRAKRPAEEEPAPAPRSKRQHRPPARFKAGPASAKLKGDETLDDLLPPSGGSAKRPGSEPNTSRGAKRQR